MNFTKLISLFAFVTLAVLSLGLASAAPDTCLGVVSQSMPLTAVNNQGTLQASFNITFTCGAPEQHSISSIVLNSYSGSSTTSTGNWNPITLQITLNSSLNNLTTITTTFNIPNSFIGTLGTNITINSTNITGGTTTSYSTIFQLPSVTITQPSSNLTMSASTGPFRTNQNATLTISNTGNTNFGQVTMSETGTTLFGVTFNPSAPFSLNANASTTITAILNNLINLKFGLNTVNVQASTGTGTNSQIATTSFQVKKTFCSAGETINSNLTITDINWDNNGNGEKNDWELLDKIEVEVDIENNNEDDNVDVVAVLGLFDSTGRDVTNKLIFLGDSADDEEEVKVTIDEESEETIRWEFKVPADFDIGDYKLAVKAYDEDRGQTKDCKDTADELDNSFYQSINVDQTSENGLYVVVDEIELESQLTCGQTVSGQFKVFNVGKNDEKRVKVTIKNKDLKIQEVLEITKKLNQGDDETLDFTIDIPATATNGNYNLEFITEYDYSNGNYDQESDEPFNYDLEVLGCSQNLGNPNAGALTNLEISAKLDSKAQAGKELIVTATIKNTGDKDADYTLSANGYSDWAELTDISDTSLSVDAGESKEVTFKLLVNKDSVGAQTFDIQVASQGKVQIQEVEVELSSGSRLFNSDNSLIWIIGLVNLIIIILIIVIAIRMSKR